MLANHRTAVDEHGCGKVDNRGRRPWRRSRRPSPGSADPAEPGSGPAWPAYTTPSARRAAHA